MTWLLPPLTSLLTCWPSDLYYPLIWSQTWLCMGLSRMPCMCSVMFTKITPRDLGKESYLTVCLSTYFSIRMPAFVSVYIFPYCQFASVVFSYLPYFISPFLSSRPSLFINLCIISLIYLFIYLCTLFISCTVTKPGLLRVRQFC